MISISRINNIHELKEKLWQSNKETLNLMDPAMMRTSQNTSGVSENVQLMSEILTKINNAKDKPKKIAILREHASAPLKQVLKGAFDPNIVWDLPT